MLFRWFWHFYATSVGWNGLLFVLYLNFIFRHQSYPSWLTEVLDILTGEPSSDSQGELTNHRCVKACVFSVLLTLMQMFILLISVVPQLSTVLALLLLCIHSLRRLLECLCVSVFSDGVIHLVQYVFGLGYYILLGLTVLCSDHLGKGSVEMRLHVIGYLLVLLCGFDVCAVHFRDWNSLQSAGLVSCDRNCIFHWCLTHAASVHGFVSKAPHWEVR